MSANSLSSQPSNKDLCFNTVQASEAPLKTAQQLHYFLNTKIENLSDSQDFSEHFKEKSDIEATIKKTSASWKHEFQATKENCSTVVQSVLTTEQKIVDRLQTDFEELSRQIPIKQRKIAVYSGGKKDALPLAIGKKATQLRAYTNIGKILLKETQGAFALSPAVSQRMKLLCLLTQLFYCKAKISLEELNQLLSEKTAHSSRSPWMHKDTQQDLKSKLESIVISLKYEDIKPLEEDLENLRKEFEEITGKSAQDDLLENLAVDPQTGNPSVDKSLRDILSFEPETTYSANAVIIPDDSQEDPSLTETIPRLQEELAALDVTLASRESSPTTTLSERSDTTTPTNGEETTLSQQNHSEDESIHTQSSDRSHTEYKFDPSSKSAKKSSSSSPVNPHKKLQGPLTRKQKYEFTARGKRVRRKP